MSLYTQAQERVRTALMSRTPADPPTRIESPGLQIGNTDLQPATWDPPSWVQPIIGGAA